jgi:hypothetical protein
MAAKQVLLKRLLVCEGRGVRAAWGRHAHEKHKHRAGTLWYPSDILTVVPRWQSLAYLPWPSTRTDPLIWRTALVCSRSAFKAPYSCLVALQDLGARLALHGLLHGQLRACDEEAARPSFSLRLCSMR